MSTKAGELPFNHYWGASDVHTLVFDFDGTLVDTWDAQMKAWVHAADVARARGIVSVLGEKVSTKEMRDLFAMYQADAREIMNHLYPSTDAEQKQQVDGIRTARRDELTQVAPSSADVWEAIETLAKRFTIAIVSATRTESIRKYICESRSGPRWRIGNNVHYVLGVDEPGYFTQEATYKSFQLLKLADLLGVPLERMVFFGDSQNDYESAADLGVEFVEVRVSKLLPPVKTRSNDGIMRLTGVSFAQIESSLSRIEERMVGRKYRGERRPMRFAYLTKQP